jgi:electron transfer flavoprotein alpha subunit
VDSKNIWVIIEKRNGKIHPVTYELLTKGRQLRDALGERLLAVHYGKGSAEDRKHLQKFGAEEILEIWSEGWIKRSYELMAEVLYMAAEREKPSIILAGATAFGRTIMPLIAVRLKTGLTADCTELQIYRERKILLQTRPAFGGNILATIECANTKPQMATVRPHVFGMQEVTMPINAPVRSKKFNPVLKRVTEIVETIIEEVRMDITEADVIVSGGRGLGKPEGFQLLQRLSEKLGGMTGASRGAVDLGWYSSAFQVGQTGHTVNPRLYIACGISGAVQHVAGMKGAEIIIAINEDPDAPIFEIADYGIIGDLYDVIPCILKQLEG